MTTVPVRVVWMAVGRLGRRVLHRVARVRKRARAPSLLLRAMGLRVRAVLRALATPKLALSTVAGLLGRAVRDRVAWAFERARAPALPRRTVEPTVLGALAESATPNLVQSTEVGLLGRAVRDRVAWAFELARAPALPRRTVEPTAWGALAESVTPSLVQSTEVGLHGRAVPNHAVLVRGLARAPALPLPMAEPTVWVALAEAVTPKIVQSTEAGQVGRHVLNRVVRERELARAPALPRLMAEPIVWAAYRRIVTRSPVLLMWMAVGPLGPRVLHRVARVRKRARAPSLLLRVLVLRVRAVPLELAIPKLAPLPSTEAGLHGRAVRNRAVVVRERARVPALPRPMVERIAWVALMIIATRRLVLWMAAGRPGRRARHRALEAFKIARAPTPYLLVGQLVPELRRGIAILNHARSMEPGQPGRPVMWPVGVGCANARVISRDRSLGA